MLSEPELLPLAELAADILYSLLMAEWELELALANGYVETGEGMSVMNGTTDGLMNGTINGSTNGTSDGLLDALGNGTANASVPSDRTPPFERTLPKIRSVALQPRSRVAWTTDEGHLFSATLLEEPPEVPLSEFVPKAVEILNAAKAVKAEAAAKAGVEALAKMPSLDELRGRLVGLVKAPAAKLARVAQAPAGKVARVIQARADQLQQG